MPGQTRDRLFATFILMALALCASLVWSQENVNAPAVEAGKEASSFKEQTIYVPYEKLRETFEKNGRGVFLPYERFQQLWQAARDREVPTPQTGPPTLAVVTQVSNEAVVDGDVMRVRSEIKIDVLGSGWIKIPLQLNDVAVIAATMDDEPARLVPDNDGGITLLLQKDDEQPQRRVLRVEYAKSYSRMPGQNSVSFAATRAPVNRWRIRIPEPGVKVNVHPMLAASQVPESATENGQTQPDGETVLLAFVGSAPSVRIDWTPKSEGATGLEALVSVQSQQQVYLDEGIIRTRTRLSYEISRAELGQLQIEVPDDHKVVDVVDANVRRWEVVDGDGVQRINVVLFQPAGRQQEIVVELEKFTEDAEFAAPIVKAIAAGRQRGILVVRLAEGLRADPQRRAGLLQLDSEDIPQSLAREKWTFSYRYASLPFTLAMKVEKIEPRISVDQLVTAHLQPQQLTVQLFAKYHIERAGVFELAAEIPAGFDVQQVQGWATPETEAAAVDSFAVTGQGELQRLQINLSSKALGDVGLLIELTRSLDEPHLLTPSDEAAEIRIVPPRIADNHLVQAEGRLVIYAPESLRVGVRQVAGLRTVSFDAALGNLPADLGQQRFPDLRPVMAYRFAREPAQADLTAQRRKPQVVVRQLMIARIESGIIKYDTTFYFDVKYSSVKSLRLDVPAALTAALRNETPALREAAMDPQPDNVEAGYVAWQLKGETELIGASALKLTWEQPLVELGVGKSLDVQVPRLVPQEVDRAEGQIVLAKSETIDVQPKGTPKGLDPIDPQYDLVPPVRIPDAAAALEFHDDWELTLTATRYQLEALKATSISQALLRMVVTRSDRISVQALYRMRSNRQRLEIHLPLEAAAGMIEFDTDPLRINGRAVTLEQGSDKQTFFVPLVGYTANEPFVLELRYTSPGNGTRFDYPTFPDEPAVQKVYLAAYVPRERVYVGARGPWTDEMAVLAMQRRPFERRPVPRSTIEQLIQRLRQGINMVGDPASDFAVDGEPLLFSTLRPAADGVLRLATLHRNGLYGILFAILAVLGLLLVRASFIMRLTCIALVLGVLVLVGVFLPTFASQILDQTLLLAAVPVALLWLVSDLVRWRPRLTAIRWPTRRRPETIARDPSNGGRNDQSERVTGAPDASASGPSPPGPQPPPEQSPPTSEQDNGQGGRNDD